jgi:hypothetical protein
MITMLPNVVLGVFGEVLLIVIYNCIAASSVFPRRDRETPAAFNNIAHNI